MYTQDKNNPYLWHIFQFDKVYFLIKLKNIFASKEIYLCSQTLCEYALEKSTTPDYEQVDPWKFRLCVSYLG